MFSAALEDLVLFLIIYFFVVFSRKKGILETSKSEVAAENKASRPAKGPKDHRPKQGEFMNCFPKSLPPTFRLQNSIDESGMYDGWGVAADIGIRLAGTVTTNGFLHLFAKFRTC